MGDLQIINDVLGVVVIVTFGIILLVGISKWIYAARKKYEED